MRPQRTLLYKLLRNIMGGVLVASVLLAGGVVFVLVAVSMKDPHKMEATLVEGEAVAEVYLRNRTRSPLIITVRLSQHDLPLWQERFQHVNPSHHKAVVVWPVTGQPDSADVVQTVAPDSSTLLIRRTRAHYRYPDGTETTGQYEEGAYEMVTGPYSATPRLRVQWVDERHRPHTRQVTGAAIGRSLLTAPVAGSAQRSKTVHYLDYR